MDDETRAAIYASIEKRKAIIEAEKALGLRGKLRRYFNKKNTTEIISSIVFGVLGSLLGLKLLGVI